MTRKSKVIVHRPAKSTARNKEEWSVTKLFSGQDHLLRAAEYLRQLHAAESGGVLSAKRERGRPPKPMTALVIEAEAQRLSGGGHPKQYQVSQQFWPDETSPKRYDLYRSSVNNNRAKIAARLKQLKAQKRRPNTTV